MEPTDSPLVVFFANRIICVLNRNYSIGMHSPNFIPNKLITCTVFCGVLWWEWKFGSKGLEYYGPECAWQSEKNYVSSVVISSNG